MKRQATRRNEESRKSAECTGFFATTTATAVASASTANTTNAQPAPPVRRTPEGASVIGSSPLLDHGERLDVGGRPPVGQLADVQVQRLVAVVGRHLVGLRRQPDGLGLRRAGLLAE